MTTRKISNSARLSEWANGPDSNFQRQRHIDRGSFCRGALREVRFGGSKPTD